MSRCSATGAAEVVDELVQMRGGPCTLHGCLAYPAIGNPALAVLLLGAHPLLGGEANNNVVRALRCALAARGAAALSFDYRGTAGRDSSGLDWDRMIADFWRDSRVPEESLWLEDARAAATWLSETVPARLMLVGYSFGCRLLSELAPSLATEALICVSPNPAQHDLSKLAASRVPLLVVSSDNDFSCPPDVLNTWLAARVWPASHVLLHGAEHFFRGRESNLVSAVFEFLAARRLVDAAT